MGNASSMPASSGPPAVRGHYDGGHAGSLPDLQDPVEGVLASMLAGGGAAEDHVAPHVFVSHAGEQKQDVADILQLLFKERHPQLVVFVDEWSLQGGDRVLRHIGDACMGAAVGVLLLSKEFVRKKHCMAELRLLLQRCNGQQPQHTLRQPPDEHQQRDQQQGGVRLLPVLYGLTVEQLRGMRALYDSEDWCVDEPKPAPAALDAWAADLRAVAEFTLIRQDQWRWNSQLVDMVLRRAVQLLDADGRLPGAASGLEVHNFTTPLPATEMVGRQGELQRVLEALARWRYVEIRGPPGEGKSTLAQHAVQDLCGQWQLLPKAQAAGKVSYAVEVDLGDGVGEQDLKQAVAARILDLVGLSAATGNRWVALLGWLRGQEVARLAVLLENAEEAVLVEGFQAMLSQLRALPKVHLIVATRAACPCPDQVTPENSLIELWPLGEADSMRLVEAHLGPGHAWAPDGADKEAARQLVKLVEGSPLVLSIAAGLVRARDLRWQEVLHKAEQEFAAINPKMGKKAGGMRAYMASLLKWLGSCLAEEELRLLAAVSVFAGSFTAAGAAAVGSLPATGTAADLLMVLRDVSLVRQYTVQGVSSRQPEQTAERYTMHALVREAAASLHDEQPAKQQCVQRLAKWMLQASEGPGQALLRCVADGALPDLDRHLYLLREELQNFAAAGTGLLVADDGSVEQLVVAAGNVGWVLSESGHSGAARQLQVCALQVAELLLGPNHQCTLHAKHTLAFALQQIGELGGARRLKEEVLEARTRVLGPEHPDTLLTMGNLAAALRHMGELGGARQLQKEVLEACTQVLGPEHPDTLAAMNGLAYTLWQIGELGEARRLAQEALSAFEQVLGSDHPETARTKDTLGCILRDLGQAGEGRRLQEEALAVLEPLHGPQGPEVLEIKHELGVTLLVCGDVAGARWVWEAVLEARARVLGAEHPNTLTTKNALAGLVS